MTPKHIDVPELMKTVKFEGGPSRNTEAARVATSPEWAYRTSAAEFELRRLELAREAPYRSGPDHRAEILLVLDLDAAASATLTSDRASLVLERGRVCLVPHGVPYSLEATGPTMIYKAAVPG